MVIANFPFSDEFWWLPAEQHSEEQAKKAKKGFKEYNDKYGRFTFGKPPASTGDWAFIQHILASTSANGRAGVVCPQGALFRGQPEIEEETDEFDADAASDLSRPGVFRLNIGVDRATFEGLAGRVEDPDYAALDRFLPHPVYARQHWLCILNPSASTFEERVVPLLALAHDRLAAARARHQR